MLFSRPMYFWEAPALSALATWTCGCENGTTIICGTQTTRQRTSKVWAEIMHSFARVLILDLYALPFDQLGFWVELSAKEERTRPLYNFGQWAITYKLQDAVDSSPSSSGVGNDAPNASAYGVEVQKDDQDGDELPSSVPTESDRPEVPRRGVDPMDLASDKNRWVVSAAVEATTCKSTSSRLTAGKMSSRCNNKRVCPRCASQHQIEQG